MKRMVLLHNELENAVLLTWREVNRCALSNMDIKLCFSSLEDNFWVNIKQRIATDGGNNQEDRGGLT